MGDSLIPQYRFEWEDEEDRNTTEIDDYGEANPILVNEALAEFGREDEDCEVTLSGYET